MTGRKKLWAVFILLAAVIIGTGAWVYNYYTAPQRKIERLVWELRGSPAGRLDDWLAKVGIKTDKPQSRDPEMVMTDLAAYSKLATPYLIELVKSEKNDQIKWPAAQLLIQVNDPAVIDFFRQCLKTKDPFMTGTAAAFLKDNCGSQSLLEFADLLTDSNNLDAAAVIADALGNIGGKQATDLLIGVLTRNYIPQDIIDQGFQAYQEYQKYQDLEDELKATAIKSLVKIGDKRAIGPITAELRAKIVHLINLETIAGFYFLGDPKASADIVLRFIDANSRNYFRWTPTAAEGFGGLNPSIPLSSLFSPPLPKFLCDPVVIMAIGKLGGLDEVYLLLQTLRYECMKSDFPPDNILNALADIGDARAKKPIAMRIWNSKNETVPAAINALIKLNAYDELLAFMKNDDNYIYRDIALALVKLKNPNLLEILLKMFDSGIFWNEDLHFLGRCIGKLGDRRAIEPMRKAIGDKHSDKRLAAITALYMIDGRQSLEYLMPICDRKVDPNDLENKWDIYYAAKAIIQTGESEDVAFISRKFRMIGDRDLDLGLVSIISDYWWRMNPENVIPFLENADSEVRKIAAETLGKIGDRKAVVPLIKTLKDNDKDVRTACIVALCKIGDSRAVEPIIEVFEDVLNGWCVESIANFGDPRFAQPILNHMRNISIKETMDFYTRKSPVLHALGMSKNPTATDALIKVIESPDKGEYDKYQYVAIADLGNVGGKRAFDYLSDLQRFKSVLDDEAYYQAIVALGKFANPVSIDSFVAVVNTYPYGTKYPRGGFDIRKAAIEAIGGIGGPKAIDALTKFLDHGYIDVRTESARALFAMNDSSTRSALEKAAGDIHWQVRAYANAGLYKFGDKAVIESVIALLKTNDPKRRSIAVDILCILKDRQLAKYLIDELLNNPKSEYASYYYDDVVNLPVIDTLVEIGSSEVLEAFRKLMKQWEDEIEDIWIIEPYYKTGSHSYEADEILKNIEKIHYNIIKVQHKMASAATQPAEK
ncbi:MAG: HEAT repeat domain-containing protein [Planctomycetes bacterium]|nr:HEAT repeat domain-containing protein [Planctomycetota bacterium]